MGIAKLLSHARRFRRIMTWYPPFWGTGISIRHVSVDFHQLLVVMKPRFYNVNAFGSHFGGSMSAMTDPFYTLMLTQILGSDYRVVDASAHITFLKPGKGVLRAPHQITDRHLEEIRLATANGDKHFMAFTVEILDEQDQVVARVDKQVYVRLRKERRPRGNSEIGPNLNSLG